MTRRTVPNYLPYRGSAEVDPAKPTVEVHLYRHIAICLGAWGAGDTAQEAVKQMVKAGGSTKRYIAYESPSDKLTCEGASLVAYPPAEGFANGPGAGFDDVNETRYVKGKGFATGQYDQVEWPDAKPAKAAK